MDSFGEELNDYVLSLTDSPADQVRQTLRKNRDVNLCKVQEFFEAIPGLPAFTCDDQGETPAASFAGDNQEDSAIPDNDPAGATSLIEARTGQAIPLSSVEIQVEVEHSWRGDLLIELTSPAGQTQEVHAFDSDDSDDGFTERFTVAGYPSNEDATGSWSLRVIDRAGQDTGTLLGWSLGINTAAP